MKIELPEIKSRFKVSEDVILECRDDERMICYTMLDLYKVNSVSKVGSWGHSGKPYFGTPHAPEIPREPSIQDFIAHIGQTPPYIKHDSKGLFIEYLLPKDTVFSFHRVKWNNSYPGHVAIKVGMKVNKSLSLNYIPLVYMGRYSYSYEKKNMYVCEFPPEEFAKINFEKVTP